ncbi:MAG: adenine specific DNA methylase Mod, partial [Fimbriimonadales bacterium]
CGLLRASRRFSWAEHKAPKLFRSRTKLREMEQLLQTDWRKYLNQFIWERSLDALRRVRALAQLTRGHSCRAIALAGVDSALVDLSDVPQADLVVTSPPYLQAQEYIRTFKLDLFWLGYSEELVRHIAQLEIPYRKAPEQFHSPTYVKVQAQVARADLREMMNSYFYYTTAALRNAATKLKRGGYLVVFVGNPRVDGIEVETWRIIAEDFETLGFSTQGIYEDAIKNRQLFRGRRNKNPEGMPSEFLLVMRREE